MPTIFPSPPWTLRENVRNETEIVRTMSFPREQGPFTHPRRGGKPTGTADHVKELYMTIAERTKHHRDEVSPVEVRIGTGRISTSSNLQV